MKSSSIYVRHSHSVIHIFYLSMDKQLHAAAEARHMIVDSTSQVCESASWRKAGERQARWFRTGGSNLALGGPPLAEFHSS